MIDNTDDRAAAQRRARVAQRRQEAGLPSAREAQTISRAVRMIHEGVEGQVNPRVFNFLAAAVEKGLIRPAEAAHLRAVALKRAERLDEALLEWADSLAGDRITAELVVHYGSALFEVFDVEALRRLFARYAASSPQTHTLNEQQVGNILRLIERTGSDAHLPPGLQDRARELAATSADIAGYLYRLQYRQRHVPFEATKIVSLGLHCLPWTLPSRWGMRSPDDNIALEGPFDLARHDIQTVIRLVRDGFAGYADPKAIRTTWSPKGHLIPYNLKFKAVWNHQKNDYWTRDQFARLRNTLERKIEYFGRVLQGNHRVFLIGDLPFPSADEVRETLASLRAALASRMPAGAKFLVMATTQADRGLTYGQRTEFDPYTVHYTMTYPAETYQWPDDSHANSAAGLQWEEQYIAWIRAEIARVGFPP